MTTTGTYAQNPSAAHITLNAYGMINIRRTELTTQHLSDAALALNLLMVDMSNRVPMQWTLETQQVPLVAGTPSYTLTNRTIAISVAYISTLSGSVTTDRVIGAISASEYGAIPNKSQQAPPTSYWLSLQTTPTITLWPVPDSTSSYTLNLQTFRQLQDADLTQGYTLDSPYRFLDAISTGLAARLADLYRPEKAAELDIKFERRFALAASRDQESVSLYITPGLSGYFAR
jgi:hypothetical protein